MPSAIATGRQPDANGMRISRTLNGRYWFISVNTMCPPVNTSARTDSVWWPSSTQARFISQSRARIRTAMPTIIETESST